MGNEFSIELKSEYGTFIMNRRDQYQPNHIVATCKPHIYQEIDYIINVVNTLGDNCVFLDIGGNIGLISIPVARFLQSKRGKVYTFEPQRIMYYMLAGNVVLNNLTNLYCYNLAVSDKEDWLAIPSVNYFDKNDFGTVTFVNSTIVSDKFVGQEKVRTIVIDKLGLDRVDMMKIDVEGMEKNVINGAKETIAKFRPLIFVEHFLARPEDRFNEFITNLGYNIHIADYQNWLCIPTEKEHLYKK